MEINQCEFKDFFRITEFYQKWSYGRFSQILLNWKYNRNPWGKGRLYLIQNEDKEIVGTLGYIPCKIYDSSFNSTLAMQATDLFISPDMRKKGFFILLQKHAMSEISNPLIAFPNERSERITIKLGWHSISRFERWVLPVFNQKRRKNLFLNSIFTILRISFQIYYFFQLSLLSKPVKMKLIKKFENNFSKMNESKLPGPSDEYLNWRFIDHPVENYKCFLFMHENMAIGYCVLRLSANCVEIFDLFCIKYKRSCILKILNHFKKQNISHLEYFGVGLNLWKYGFFRFPFNRNIVGCRLDYKPAFLNKRFSDW